MATIDQILCTLYTGNGGYGSCYYKKTAARWVILKPVADHITATNATNIVDFIKGKLLNDIKLSRWIAFGPLKDVTPGGEAVTTITMDDGSVEYARDPTEVLDYTLLDGGMCNWKNLNSFSGSQNDYEPLFIDKDGFMITQNTTNDTTGARELTGRHANSIYVPPVVEPKYTEVAMSHLIFNFVDPKGDQANTAYIDLNNGVPKSFRADTFFKTNSVQTATMSESPVSTVNGVFNLLLLGSCGNDNLAVRYGAALANIANFTMKNRVTGAAITFTAALNGAGNQIVLTASTVDTDYPASGGEIIIELAAISVLDANGIKYYESRGNNGTQLIVKAV